ncbi:hypothetical protein QAD02_000186 [Eretmocerus hayati]|uniref:Uncharacterized protein n=1 Tax=Eretmocerus hayati TaxID=131215 RepID=A0ACC2NCQ7_9HYME|nr:hypothetical protein QAD02_000186 [Eretmocerus hayati]
MEPVNNNNESGASISDISLEPSIDPKEDTSKSESKGSCDETSLDSKSGDSNSFVVRQWKKFKTLPDFSESKLTEMLELRNQLFTSGLVKETLRRHNEITVTEPSKLDERKSRVTGTTGYGLFTYTQNAHTSEDWKKKIESFVAPKDFSTEAIEYGRKNEAPAREIFKSQNPNIEAIETGLIICKSLPWIACTPDGVVVHDGKIVSLLEIKCFVNGKSEGIHAVVEKQISKGCLRRRNNVVVMRERNRYYGQVQLGMALLNVGSCKFVLYSSFDKNIFVVDVPKDRLFLVKMLRRLKDLYYATILPGICALESDNHTPSSHADKRHLIVKYEDTKPQKPKPPVKPKKAMCTSTPKKPKKVIIPLSPRSSKVRI